MNEREAADALNLATRVIRDMESEAWDRVGTPPFVRGYLRAYAKLLGIEGRDIVAGYDEFRREQERTVPLPEPPPPTGLEQLITRTPGGAVTLIGGGVAVVLLILVILWPDAQRSARTSSAPSAAAPAVTRETASEPPGLATQPASREPGSAPLEPDQAETGTVNAAPADPAAAMEPLAEADAESDATAPKDTRAEAQSVRRLTPEGDERLTFTFDEDCWVEIKDSTGRNLYSDLRRSGDVLDLIGAGPFRILLGYAPGASLEFNGEPVPLAPHTRNNVASLVLGQ